MGSQLLMRIIPKCMPLRSRPCLKRACSSHQSGRHQSTLSLQFEENDTSYRSDTHISDGHFDFKHLLHQEMSQLMPRKPGELQIKVELKANLHDNRLQILRNQLQCPEADLLQMYKKVPRLRDLKLLDEVIRNVEIMLYVFQPKQVAWVFNRILFHLVQVDNVTLRNLAFNWKKSETIFKFMKKVDLRVKGDSVSNAEFFSSLLGVEILDQEPLVFTSHISYCNIKEKVDYLLQEGVSPSFLRDYDILLMYSLERLDQEVQYIKREFGEMDSGLLRGRILSSHSKGYRKSLSVAAKLLECPISAITKLQTSCLVGVYPSVVEQRIRLLFHLGFSSHNIRSCIYIIRYEQEQIEMAKGEVLRTYSIDGNNKKMLINAMYYHLKKSEGSGS